MTDPSAPQIDYRALLKKFIEHADGCNGNGTVSEIENGKSNWSDVTFTPDEVAILQEIDRSIT
jgi:hypothetical protein